MAQAPRQPRDRQSGATSRHRGNDHLRVFGGRDADWSRPQLDRRLVVGGVHRYPRAAGLHRDGNQGSDRIRRWQRVKSATWRRLCRTYMVPHLPPVRLVRNLTIFPPTEHLLRALSTDSSGFGAARFVVEAFVMPLYVPSDHIYYTFGGRLGALSGHQERWWTISDENES